MKNEKKNEPVKSIKKNSWHMIEERRKDVIL
jgi:hypothetical protein